MRQDVVMFWRCGSSDVSIDFIGTLNVVKMVGKVRVTGSCPALLGFCLSVLLA